MKKNKFQAKYEINDGYAGKTRPQHFSIDADDLKDDMSDEELEHFYEQAVHIDFQQRITPCSQRTSEFVEWAKQQLAERSKE